ncbi:MAG: DJ-1/PfpI family protein [Candidatus Omnitrophica bacterium]|nr:DJ-1/PfpI family protein [Candidatus Omnitrophota bacterium]
MNKKALIILASGFEEIEAVTPIDILRRANIEVTVAGLGAKQIKGSRGLIVNCDVKLEDVVNLEFDACILPGGGEGAKNLAASKMVESIITRHNDNEKIIAAICASPAIVLAPWKILKNKSATTYPGTESHFSSDTTYSNEAVVVDENIITSKGAGTAIAFALAIVEKLSNLKTSTAIKNSIIA